MAKKLQEIVVCEWRMNEREYEGYVQGNDISNEIEKYLQNGYFFGELGNKWFLQLQMH